MEGYVARKGDRWYAVSYQGMGPPGRERRAWHAAGPDRADAERLAARLAGECNGRRDEARSPTLGAYLSRRWLPGKRVALAASTYAGYCRNVERHVVPALGRIALRRLRPHHLEAFCATLLRHGDGSTGLAPKTVYEIPVVIRGALTTPCGAPRDPNVALVQPLPERGKTASARRRSDLDQTTIALLGAWRAWQATEQRAIGIEPSGRMFTDGHGGAIHPHAISQAFERIARRAGVSMIRLHDMRHTHGTLLIAAASR